MKTADLHCDTISLLLEKRRAGEKQELLKNDLHVDLQKMRSADYLLQNFALFVDQGSCKDVYEEAKEEYRLFAEEMEKNRDSISQIFCFADLIKNREENRMSALLAVEEGEVCHGSLEILKEFYDLGTRMMTLVWNYDNSLSTSAVKKNCPVPRKYSGSREGLTETGLEFVQRMEELGMIPDVSHMSDEGIEDMFQVAKKPFAASHSNARELCPHKRNLPDRFLKKMGERGCLIGVNFYSEFLQSGAGISQNDRIADHILYLVNKAGIESVGLGSDFDGIDCQLEVKHCGNVQMLAETLSRRGLTAMQIERIFYKNVMSFYRELL